MCRFAAYVGPEITIESLTTLPSHSIIKQSYHAQERLEPLNGDGFGIAWFNPGLSDEPAAYRAVTPAWNDENLIHLARVTRSTCILAHVRAASPGLGVSPFNCHPFLGDGFAFMHNGGVAGFSTLKRPLLRDVGDALWYGVRGTTDSEALFAVFRHKLASRTEDTKHERMRGALEATIARVLELSKEHGVTDVHQLNLCVTDGTNMVVTRFASNGEPNTLYVNEGRRYICVDGLCQMIEPDEHGGAVLVASEALSEGEDWERVPVNHSVMITPQREVQIRAIADHAS